MQQLRCINYRERMLLKSCASRRRADESSFCACPTPRRGSFAIWRRSLKGPWHCDEPRYADVIEHGARKPRRAISGAVRRAGAVSNWRRRACRCTLNRVRQSCGSDKIAHGLAQHFVLRGSRARIRQPPVHELQVVRSSVTHMPFVGGLEIWRVTASPMAPQFPPHRALCGFPPTPSAEARLLTCAVRLAGALGRSKTGRMIPRAPAAADDLAAEVWFFGRARSTVPSPGPARLGAS